MIEASAIDSSEPEIVRRKRLRIVIDRSLLDIEVGQMVVKINAGLVGVVKRISLELMDSLQQKRVFVAECNKLSQHCSWSGSRS